ncbi:MAG: hypothetical protein U1F43_02865 [Myxococcota bacterium]
MHLDELTRALADHGFDVVRAGPIGAYHAAVPAAFRLPFADDRCIVLVGASGAIWSHFRQALAREPWRRQADHPFDGWAAPLIDAAARALAAHAGCRVDVFHYQEPPPRRVALQHLAEVLGVAGRAPCGLSIHPELGPWLSFRAAIVLDLPAPALAPTPAWPCASCRDKPCLPPFERALAATGHGSVQAHAERWIAVRDACPIGRPARYTDGQIRWHHAHDRQALEESG